MAEQLGLLDPPDLASRHGSGLLLAIRESSRARHLILQVIPPGTVEVVVPRGTRPQDVRTFVDEHRCWIEQAGDALKSQFRGEDVALPRSIDLAAVERSFAVSYEHDPRARPAWRVEGRTLVLRCADEAFEDADSLLRRWLMRQGREHLKPWLAREAARLGVAPRGVHIRLQRTRWGSCSGQGTISLNASLMLVPPALVRYLLVHELCHLRHLNHSPRYWRTVARFEPGFERLDRELSASWTTLPAWVYRVARAAWSPA